MTTTRFSFISLTDVAREMIYSRGLVEAYLAEGLDAAAQIARDNEELYADEIRGRLSQMD